MKHPNRLLPPIPLKYYINQPKVRFPNKKFVSMLSIYNLSENFCVIWAKFMKLHKDRPVLTSQFDVSKPQKQVRSVIQIYLDQSSNFGPLPLNICVTVNHNVAFYNINRKKWQKMQQSETNIWMKHRNKFWQQFLQNLM